MSRTVSTFFTRDVTGFSEPGKCPRCKRKVNVGGKGGTKAHKCPHGAWCNATDPCPACTAKAPRGSAKGFTVADCEALRPLIVRAAVAAVRQAKASARWVKAPGDHPRLQQLGDALIEAELETYRAGKALDRALAKLRGGK